MRKAARYQMVDGSCTLWITTGGTVDGNAWGDNIPENMAPVMDRFFHGE